MQAKFLLRNGADAVAYPEKQLAKWAAIRYTANHIFSYIELDEQHAIIEVAVPEDWQGRSIGELDIRRKYGVNILGVKRNGKTDVNISPEIILDGSLTLLVLGRKQSAEKTISPLNPLIHAEKNDQKKGTHAQWRVSHSYVMARWAAQS